MTTPSSPSPLGRAALGVASVALALVGAATPASAQVPGADDSGTVVITNSTVITVSVDNDSPTNGVVSGRLTNRTGNSFSCYAPGKGATTQYPNQVTEAAIVVKAMRYYASNVFIPIGGLDLPVSGVTLDAVPLGSLYDMLPSGSLGLFTGQSIGGMATLGTMQDAARVAGHTGNPTASGNTVISVPGNSTVSWTAQLGAPASGSRQDFQSGALFYCTDTSTNKAYVFAGYEGGTAPSVH